MVTVTDRVWICSELGGLQQLCSLFVLFVTGLRVSNLELIR